MYLIYNAIPVTLMQTWGGGRGAKKITNGEYSSWMAFTEIDQTTGTRLRALLRAMLFNASCVQLSSRVKRKCR